MGLKLEPPTTAKGKISISINEFWSQYRSVSPLVEAYCSYKEKTKLRTFVEKLIEQEIHPRYRIFVRTGRTSCSGPNIQQLPRGSHVREVIVPRPGKLLLTIDYSSLELRTLAAVCYERYGFSNLGEVLKRVLTPIAIRLRCSPASNWMIS